MKLRTVFMLALTLVFASQALVAQVDVYKRSTIPPPLAGAGWGDAVAGVDFDGDGKKEIYAVNNNMLDGATELIPRIYKYELDDTTWSLVWSATLNIPKQNTWPALTYGDWDKDGKMEIIWGPVNFTDPATNPNPARIIVFEAVGNGSDNMGVSDGSGGWRPNAQWAITNEDNYNLRPFRWLLHDIDSDGTQELIFCDRASSSPGVGYKFGVVSVSNIPDNGDSSEVWTLEASGDGVPTAQYTVYDIAVVDSTIYLFHATSNGTVSRVRYRGGAYIVDSASVALAGVTIGGGFKNAQVVDFDGDGKKEIVIAGYSSATYNRIYLAQPTAGGDSLTATLLFDPDALVGSGARLVGSAAGDIDGDGKMDVIFGSRDAVPGDALLRMEYKSGDITNPASYDFSILEKGFGTGAERIDFINIFNADADADLEILYGSAYGSEYDYPMVLLDRVSLPAVSVEGSEGLPTEFALYQNYPNPFNPTTTIRVALLAQSYVTLKIYNLLGEEVATLVNEEHSAGYLNVQWNGRNRFGQQVATGVYLYRVVAKSAADGSEFISNRKMMLVK